MQIRRLFKAEVSKKSLCLVMMVFLTSDSPDDKDDNGKFIHLITDTSVWPLGFINIKIKNILITFSVLSQSQEIVSLYY